MGLGHMGASNPIQVSHWGVMDISTGAISTASQGVQQQEAGVRRQSWVTSPGTLKWDTGVLTFRLYTCCPQIYSEAARSVGELARENFRQLKE